MDSLVDEGRAVAVVHHIIKAFIIAFLNILRDKLKKSGLQKCTVRWIENELNDQAQIIVISSTKSIGGQSQVIHPRD